MIKPEDKELRTIETLQIDNCGVQVHLIVANSWLLRPDLLRKQKDHVIKSDMDDMLALLD